MENASASVGGGGEPKRDCDAGGEREFRSACFLSLGVCDASVSFTFHSTLSRFTHSQIWFWVTLGRTKP